MSVEILCVLDRSGSMNHIIDDSIGGFNSFLREQKSLSGAAKLSLILFDDLYEVVHDRVDIQCVPEITREIYTPRGTTSLYDAIGKASVTLGESLAKNNESPDKVIVVILTDGAENSSLEYTKERVADIIKHQQEKYSWEFVFLAANQDAFSVSAGLNISAHNTANFAFSGLGTSIAYATASQLTRAYRNNA